MFYCFDEEDLIWFFREWRKEAEEITAKMAKLDEFEKKLKEAKKPFIREQKEFLEQKRKTDRKASLTVEERDKIWKPFRGVSRKIAVEVFGK
jgi:hypothetical protein